MAKETVNIVGERYGKLVVLKETDARTLPSGQKIRRYNCQCDCGTVFEASKATIVKNQCCSLCSALNKRLSVFLKRLSETDSCIEYISGFVNYKQPVTCRCNNCGLIWHNMTPNSLVKESPVSKCPHCGKIEKSKHITLTQDEFERKVATKNPHIIITGNYTKARNPIDFKCTVCNQEQTVCRAEVLSRVEHFCPICNKKYRYNTQSFANKISLVNPNIEIIGKYISNSQRIKCKCSLCGHIWNPIADQISQGFGCPECNITGTSFVEQVVLCAFRKIFGYNAVIHRDKNTIGMELDIYIPSLKLAIEPGGWYWHKQSYDRDVLKHNCCKENDIRCITIYDQVFDKVTHHYPDDFWFYNIDLGKHLDELKAMVYKLIGIATQTECALSDDDWQKIFFDAKEQNIRRHENFMLKLQHKNPKSSQIKIKSIYSRNTDQLECECQICGYGQRGEWSTTGASLLNGHGCPNCSANLPKDDQSFRKELRNINPSVSVSGNYVNRRTPIACICETCGFKWLDEPRVLLKGLGCPVCTLGRRINHTQFIARMQKWRPDIEVIGEYINSKTAVSCKCKKCEYEWSPIPTSLYNKNMCPNCADAQRRKSLINRYKTYGSSNGKKVRNVTTGETFPSIKNAASSKNISIYSLRQCLYKKTEMCGGFVWEFIK